MQLNYAPLPWMSNMPPAMGIGDPDAVRGVDMGGDADLMRYQQMRASSLMPDDDSAPFHGAGMSGGGGGGGGQFMEFGGGDQPRAPMRGGGGMSSGAPLLPHEELGGGGGLMSHGDRMFMGAASASSDDGGGFAPPVRDTRRRRDSGADLEAFMGRPINYGGGGASQGAGERRWKQKKASLWERLSFNGECNITTLVMLSILGIEMYRLRKEIVRMV
jgi:hypothetical protein